MAFIKDPPEDFTTEINNAVVFKNSKKQTSLDNWSGI